MKRAIVAIVIVLAIAPVSHAGMRYLHLTPEFGSTIWDKQLVCQVYEKGPKGEVVVFEGQELVELNRPLNCDAVVPAEVFEEKFDWCMLAGIDIGGVSHTNPYHAIASIEKRSDKYYFQVRNGVTATFACKERETVQPTKINKNQKKR